MSYHVVTSCTEDFACLCAHVSVSSGDIRGLLAWCDITELLAWCNITHQASSSVMSHHASSSVMSHHASSSVMSHHASSSVMSHHASSSVMSHHASSSVMSSKVFSPTAPKPKQILLPGNFQQYKTKQITIQNKGNKCWHAVSSVILIHEAN